MLASFIATYTLLRYLLFHEHNGEKRAKLSPPRHGRYFLFNDAKTQNQPNVLFEALDVRVSERPVKTNVAGW